MCEMCGEESSRMTSEYKGWEDYVDRIRRNKQYKQIKEEWKGVVDEYFSPGKLGITISPEDERIPTVGHMKQIEFQISKLRNDIYTIHTRINNITDCGHGKIKQMVTPLHQANVIGRIEALEDFRRNHSGEFHVAKDLGHMYAAKAIDELQKKVRGLEDNQHKHGHTEILLRVEKLEQQHDSEALSKRVWELENNNKAYHAASMTAWNNKHEDRIIKLEQNEKLTEKTENHLGERVKELETNYEHLKIRDNVMKSDIDELKEWQNSFYKSFKLIDKKAWDEIRDFLDNIFDGTPIQPWYLENTKKLVEEQDK